MKLPTSARLQYPLNGPLISDLLYVSRAAERRSQARGKAGWTEQRKLGILARLLELRRAGKITAIWCNSTWGCRIGSVQLQCGPPDLQGTIPRAWLDWPQAERIANGEDFRAVLSGRLALGGAVAA